MGWPINHNAVVEVVIFGLCFVAAAPTDMGGLIVLTPITPAMHMLKLVDRLGLGMTAIGTGVGLDALFLLSGLCRDYTFIPAVCSSACARANRTGLLVIGITIWCPFAPIVT